MGGYSYQQIQNFLSRPLFVKDSSHDEKTSWPKISIVTPSYNQAKFLEKTILSVLNQNYPNTEYIIMDGGSSDGSAEIMRKYSKYLAYWVSEPDKGQADAISKGFEKSSGQIFAWLNSDDFYLPGTFEKVAETFRSYNCDVVYGDEYLVDKEDKIIGQKCQLPFPKWLGPAFFVYGGFGVIQPASFWTKKLYEDVGGVDKNYDFAMDTDLFTRFAIKKARFQYTKNHVVCFRLHDSSKSCTIKHIGAIEKKGQIDKYGPKVYKILRNKLLMRNLGRLYLMRHLYDGNRAYLLHRFAYKTGLKKKHSLFPKVSRSFLKEEKNRC